jgi:hypothetical protein
VSAVSFAVSVAIIIIIIIGIDIHIIDEGQCGLQSCGGWITWYKFSLEYFNVLDMVNG